MKSVKHTRSAGRTASPAISPVRQPAKSRGRRATSDAAPKSERRPKALVPSLIAEAGAALAQYAHLQARTPEVPTLDDADVLDGHDWIVAADVAPEAPLAERVLHDVLAAGYGPLHKPVTKGLVRAGMPEDEAVLVLRDAIRVGLVVARKGGGWCSWADEACRVPTSVRVPVTAPEARAANWAFARMAQMRKA